MPKAISAEEAALAAELMKQGVSVEKLRSILKANKSGDAYRKDRHAAVRMIDRLAVGGSLTANDIKEIGQTSRVAWYRRHHKA